MKLTAPTKVSFFLALIFIVVGVFAELGIVSALSGISFWLVLVGAVILIIGTLFKGL